MSWSDLNKYRLSGSITTGLTLDSANTSAGTIPSDFVTDTYNSTNYSTGTYGVTAIFEGKYSSAYTKNQFVWTPVCDSGDIKFQFRASSDDATYTSWSSLVNVSSVNNQIYNYQYFKVRFVYYSPLWTDADSIKLSIERPFYIFAKGNLIDADEINSNFYHSYQGDLLPRGGTSLTPTTGVYNLGSDIYRWRDIYCNTISTVNIIYDGNGGYIRLSETGLTSQSSSIEITGLNLDQNYCIDVLCSIYHNLNTSSSIYMVINGDSTASYNYRTVYRDNSSAESSASSADVRIKLCEIYNTDTAFISFTISGKSGAANKILSYASRNSGLSGATGTAEYKIGGDYGSGSNTVISFKLYSDNAAFGSGSMISIWATRNV